MANALIAAELSLSGIRQLIPFDQMLDAMYAVGKRLPAELRETALGGCAATPPPVPPAACAAELIFQHAAPPVWKRPAAFLRVRDRKCRPKRRGFASFVQTHRKDGRDDWRLSAKCDKLNAEVLCAARAERQKDDK